MKLDSDKWLILITLHHLVCQLASLAQPVGAPAAGLRITTVALPAYAAGDILAWS